LSDGDTKKPQGIKDLYRKAVEAPAATLVEWVFLEAKARGRLAIAERRMKEIETRTFCVLSRAWSYGDLEHARQIVMQHAPDDIEIHKAEVALADATEEVSACGRMIEHLTRKGHANAHAPNETQQRNQGQRTARAPANRQNARGVSVRPDPVAAVAGGARAGGGVHPEPAASQPPRRG
jgi:hypothetical protein